MTTVMPLLGVTILLAADPADNSLRGTVADPAGKPIAGARVDIATAAPRFGLGLFCPSCYRDCAKSTRTDDRGRFEIGDLDSKLKFTVLVTAPGRTAHHTRLLDPRSGEIKITLEAPADASPERIVLVELVDDGGKPVAGALVEPVGAQTADRRWGGHVDGADPAVSDAAGRATIVVPATFRALDVDVTIRGYSGARAAELKPGLDVHRITVPAGTRVTGRLVHDGKPAEGIRIAVVQIDRRVQHHFIKAVGAVTDAAGRFDFDHLPANEDYAIFTVVGDGPQKLVLTTKRFKARPDREARDLGDLALTRPLRLAGQLDLPPGQTLPQSARIMVHRDRAWDLIAVSFDLAGRFEIEGLPPETYEIRLAAKGWEIDASRTNYQAVSRNGIGIRLRESMTDLRLPLTPAQTPDDDNP
jgi:uncharacterized GH25 family protein